MARKCSCCFHAQASEIDAALIGGASVRDVAGRFGLSRTSVARHGTDHLPGRIAACRALMAAVDRRDTARRIAAMTRGEFLLQALERLDAAHAQAVADGDTRARIAAVDAQVKVLARVGLVGPEDATAGIIARPVPADPAELGAERMKALAGEFLSFAAELRTRVAQS